MKKFKTSIGWILLSSVVVIAADIPQKVKLPRYQPMFEGMIVRCAPDGNCHWECEFGVVTSTAMVNENMVVKPSGCQAKDQGLLILGSGSGYLNLRNFSHDGNR